MNRIPAKAEYARFKLTRMLDHNVTLADPIHELENLRAESDPGLKPVKPGLISLF